MKHKKMPSAKEMNKMMGEMHGKPKPRNPTRKEKLGLRAPRKKK